LQTCSAAQTAQLLSLHLFTPLRQFLHKSCFIVEIGPIVWTRGIQAGFMGVIEGRLGPQPLANLFSATLDDQDEVVNLAELDAREVIILNLIIAIKIIIN
jgi:hypothetical protein